MPRMSVTDAEIVEKYQAGVAVRDIGAGTERIYRVLDQRGIPRRTLALPVKQDRSLPGRRPDGCKPMQVPTLYIAHEPRSRLRAKLNRMRVEERLQG